MKYRYALLLQVCPSLSVPFCTISCPYGFNTPAGEYIGLTVFRAVNNTTALGAIYEPRVVRLQVN